MSGVLLALMNISAKQAPTFIDAGSLGYEAPVSGSLQVPFPATVAAGNFLVLHVVTQDGLPSITTPTGWTLADEESGIGSTLSKIFYRVADGSETGNVDVTLNGGIRCGGRIYRFSNGAGVEAVGSTAEASSDTSCPLVNVTTLGAKRLACQCLWVQNNTTFANASGESGADYTEAVAEAGGVGLGLNLQTAAVPTATSITGGSVTIGAATTNKITHGFAITP